LQSSAYHDYTERFDQQRITQADYDLQRSKTVKAIQNILKEYRKNCEVVENDLKAQHAKEIAILQEKIQTLETENKAIQENYTQKEKELLGKQKTEIQSLKTQMQDLEQKINSLQAENQELKSNNISQRNVITELETRLANLQVSLNNPKFTEQEWIELKQTNQKLENRILPLKVLCKMLKMKWKR